MTIVTIWTCTVTFGRFGGAPAIARIQRVMFVGFGIVDLQAPLY